MERFNGVGAGHINSYFFGGHLDVGCLRFHEEEPDFSTSSLDQKIPFLHMLQGVESPPLLPFEETNLLTLLRLRQLKKPWGEAQIQALEPESCVTNDIVESHSSAKSIEDFHRTPGVHKQNVTESSSPIHRERRKQKRMRVSKNKEEMESQRMNHIAVERNRRRQMNDHLSALRSLMPASYVLRGDQASIIGGAIEYVNELEQLVQSLEAQKRMKSCVENEEEELTVENKSEAVEIRVTVIHSHVNLKIHCPKRPGQLLRTIVALEELRLTILHLNITSSHSKVLYTFNLKMEDECKLGSSDEITREIDGVLRLINGG